MRGRRAGADRRLERALDALSRALDQTGAPWMIIGGIAVISRGVRRLTTDIDAVIRGDAVKPRTLVRLLSRHAIRPRIEGAVAFAEKNLVLLLRHRPTGVDLDLSLGWSSLEHEALAARTRVKFGTVVAFMAAPADLVVLKAVAARPRDLQDLEALLLLHPDIDVERARKRTRELAELAGADEILEGFEAVVARTRRRRRPTR